MCVCVCVTIALSVADKAETIATGAVERERLGSLKKERKIDMATFLRFLIELT